MMQSYLGSAGHLFFMNKIFIHRIIVYTIHTHIKTESEYIEDGIGKNIVPRAYQELRFLPYT